MLFRSLKTLSSAILLLAAAITLPQAQQPDGKIVIGMSLPLSGPTEKLARQYEFGAKLALEMHNTAIEDPADKVDLFVSDDGCDEKIAALAADELKAKNPDIITGLLCNSAAYHFAAAFSDSGIPVLVAGAQSERLIKDREKAGWNLFRLSPGDNEAARAAVEYFSNAWADKPYAIVDDGTVYGRNLADAFREGMEERNRPPQFQDNFRPTQSTQARLVRRLRRAGTTHVFIGASAEDVAMIARNSEELDIPLEIGSGEALSIFPYLETETLPQGSITAILKVAEISPELPPLVMVRLSEEEVEPEPYVLMGYQAVQVAIEAARPLAADTTAALQTSTFKTILGAVRFDEDRDNSVPQYRPYRWINKTFRNLQDRDASQ